MIVRSILLFPHPQQQMVMVVAWTMVYEVLFYCMFALLILNQRVGTIVFVGWMIGVLFLPRFENYLLGFAFNETNLRFAAGIGACLIVQRCRVPAPRLIASLGGAVFLVAAVCDVIQAPLTKSTLGLGYMLGSAVGVVGLVEADRSGLIRVPKLLVHLGDAAFAIYLVHFLALSVIAKVAKTMQLDRYVPVMVLFVAHLAAAIAVGWLCHCFLENPIHLWTKRFFRRSRSTVAMEPTVLRKAA